MSLWERLRRRIGEFRGGEEEKSRDFTGRQEDRKREKGAGGSGGEREGAGAEDPDARLELVGRPGGPTTEEALGVLRQARGTMAEGRVLDRLVRASEQLDDAVRVEVASLLAARGEGARALEVIAPGESVAALMLLGDLAAEAGDVPRAIGAVERVLARDLDTPGALERRARWGARMGAVAQAPARLDEPTLVAPTLRGVPFRITREVARGGAGTVYEAEDEILGRPVAFKVFHGDGRDRTSIEREVRLLAKLSGPGIVRLFDASPENGWVALEWIPRGSFRDLLRRGAASSLWSVRDWALPLARALARVHDAGLVHADVKPANVLLRSATDPLLADFGLARSVGAAAGGGSLGYIAPERMAGAPTSPRDDVFGFGRVLEDVLRALEEPELSNGWLPVVRACLAPSGERPEDGAALVRVIAASPKG